MKVRYAILPLTAVLLLAVGCSAKYFIQRDAFLAVRKVALVQYAINPHRLLGTPNADEAKVWTAQSAWEIFAQQMANNYQVIPLDQMLANPNYGGSGAQIEWRGYYTAPGALFFSASSWDVEEAVIPSSNAQQLCRNLGVDAVAVIYDSWGLDIQDFGFRAYSRNHYVINLFDKTGNLIWGAKPRGTSRQGMSLTFGVVSADVKTYVLNNYEAFANALYAANVNFAGP